MFILSPIFASYESNMRERFLERSMQLFNFSYPKDRRVHTTVKFSNVPPVTVYGVHIHSISASQEHTWASLRWHKCVQERFMFRSSSFSTRSQIISEYLESDSPGGAALAQRFMARTFETKAGPVSFNSDGERQVDIVVKNFGNDSFVAQVQIQYHIS